jgi:hypothetical protein
LGAGGTLFCFTPAVLSRTSILALVGWMVSKLGTFYVGCVLFVLVALEASPSCLLFSSCVDPQ